MNFEVVSELKMVNQSWFEKEDAILERIEEIKEESKAKCFVFDGCHKFYLIEDERDHLDALQQDCDTYRIEYLGEMFLNSCSLRFINNWKLDKTYIRQFEFDYSESTEE